jgi:hypothetical protein
MPVLKINASIFSFQAAVLPESFRNGKMRLECTATIFNVYNRTTKAIIEEENPRAALVLSTTQDSASSTSKQKNHFMLSLALQFACSFSRPGAGNVRNVYSRTYCASGRREANPLHTQLRKYQATLFEGPMH